jgi:hypothetical protein
LSPAEINNVSRAFDELAEAGEGEERAFAEQARVVFLTVVSAACAAARSSGSAGGTSRSPIPLAPRFAFVRRG